MNTVFTNRVIVGKEISRIKYNELLKKIGYKNLEKVVGASATKTIKKNGYIRMKTMEKICKYLKCEPDDNIGFKCKFLVFK